MSVQAGRLADDFLQARRENKSDGSKKKQDSEKSSDHTIKHCLRCGIPGHFAKDAE